MRQQTKLLGSLTWGDWGKERCALLPLECIPRSRLSEWPAEKVLASPALGAELVEYLLKLDEGSRRRHEADSVMERTGREWREQLGK